MMLAAADPSRIDIFKITNESVTGLIELSSWAAIGAHFGGTVGDEGLTGLVSVAVPVDACERIVPAAGDIGRIVLIRRGGTEGRNCSFGVKVYHAELAGYIGAIVYDDISEENLVTMEYDGQLEISIPSIFVSLQAGEAITDWVDESGDDGLLAQIVPELLEMQSFLFTIVTIVAGFSIFFILFMLYRRQSMVRRHDPKPRMTARQVLKLKKRPFKAETDADEHCCICLEQYGRRDTITTLPCGHFFHHSCIRPWLQDQQRVCPICKRDPLVTINERTPLLAAVNEARANAVVDDVSIEAPTDDEREPIEIEVDATYIAPSTVSQSAASVNSHVNEPVTTGQGFGSHSESS